MLFLKKNKHFDKTFKTDTVEYAGEKYTVRELSYHERMFFYSDVIPKYESNPLLSCAWLLSKACIQFLNVYPDEIVMKCGPGAIDTISNKVLEVSKMMPEDFEETEKES